MARNKYDIDEELETPFNFSHLKRLLEYMKPYSKKVLFIVILMLIASLAGLAGPLLVKIAIDKAIPNKDINLLIILTVVFAASLVVSGVCVKYRIREMSYIGQQVVCKMRLDIFSKLQKLPFSYYDSRPHGKILVRVVNYVNSLSDLLSNGLINLITDLFSLIIIIVVMFFLDVRLTLLCLAGLPILIGAVMLIKNAQRKRWQAMSWKQSNMNAYIHESICGIKVTQSFGREEENFKIFSNQGDEYKKTWMKAVRALFILWPIIDNISVAVMSVIYVAGVAWIDKGVSVGVLTAFVGYIWRFWTPIANIGNFYNSIISAMAYLERIFETIDEKTVIEDLNDAVEMPKIKGKVVFEGVSFSYDEGELILDDVSFKSNVGDTVALVGPTGAGKTTIINLISRFYDVDKGKVTIDGMDVRKATLESLRSQMGIMLQDTFIFSGTIMENIRYGKLDATDEEVINAAKAVRAHDFIMGLEDGYNTEVNERGSRLSTGQRQLISFARALLADPKILILDEATSSIDTETEILLQKGLNELLKGRTSFIIAHRLSTIKSASQILYIEDGKITERGTHDELIKAKGAYWKLYTSQFSFLEAI
jgi:ATP-binding cassette, subfamily B, multidrug efflux pump